MAQDSLEWMRQFECTDESNCTHTINDALYTIPTRQLSQFHEHAQRVINVAHKCVRERVPETTPVFFTITAPVTDEVTTEDAIGALAQTSLNVILSVDHQTDTGTVTSAVLTKICIVLRSPSYTNTSGDEVESILFLFPRLLVKRDSTNNDNDDTPSALEEIRTRVIKDYSSLCRDVPALVNWDIRETLKNETPPVVMLYGSSPKHGLSRSFFRAFNENGEVVSLEEVFDQQERKLPACYMYSLNRLARRIEKAKDLTPELKRLEELLRMIGSHRKNEYSDVVAIAQAVYEACNGSVEGSLVLEEYLGSAEQTRELWNEIPTKKPRYTTMTLRYMASRDNPIMFRKMVEAEIKTPMWKSTGPYGSDLDIANVLKAMYCHLFAYDIKNETWYYYNESHWIDDGDHASTLRERMRTEVLRLYETLNEQILRLIGQNEGESKGYKERSKNCGKVIQRLGKKGDKTAIIGEASDLFVIKDLEQKLDGVVSYNTFAYADCVLNLVPDDPEQSTYSDGRPEDFCMRNSHIRMRDKKYTMDHPDVKSLLSYCRQVLCDYNDKDEPDESIMWYQIDKIAMCLEGGNRLKDVTIMRGPTANNSKSTFESVVHDGFGEYSTTIPTAKVVGKKRGDGDGPTPALRHAQGSRLLWLKEMAKNETLNAGQLLELSSGLDPIALRDPHSKRMIEVIPSYKMFLVANNIKFDNDESGIFVRVGWVMWTSSFLDPRKHKVPVDEKDQRKQRKYPLDPNFAKKRALMVAPMMWLLGERYKMVAKYGTATPKAVEEYIEKYRASLDVFQKFLKDATEDGDGGVEIDALYNEFIQWFKRHYPRNPYYSQYDLEDYMVKNYGDPRWGTTWEGIILRPKVQRVTNLS